MDELLLRFTGERIIHSPLASANAKRAHVGNADGMEEGREQEENHYGVVREMSSRLQRSRHPCASMRFHHVSSNRNTSWLCSRILNRGGARARHQVCPLFPVFAAKPAWEVPTTDRAGASQSGFGAGKRGDRPEPTGAEFRANIRLIKLPAGQGRPQHATSYREIPELTPAHFRFGTRAAHARPKLANMRSSLVEVAPERSGIPHAGPEFGWALTRPKSILAGSDPNQAGAGIRSVPRCGGGQTEWLSLFSARGAVLCLTSKRRHV